MAMNANDYLSLKNCDCLELLATLADNSIDLIATDPPYYKIKSDAWDNQWKSKQEFMSWLESVIIEYERVLKPTGSFYMFCSPYLASEIEMLIDKHLRVVNHIVWRKNSGPWNKAAKDRLIKFFPQTERIIFAESREHPPFAFEAIRRYLDDAVKSAGLTRKRIDDITGAFMSRHWFARSQFSIPSEKHYKTLQSIAPKLTWPYSVLYNKYHELNKKKARRYFRVTKEVPFTDVWDFNKVEWYENKHPCEKPLDLMKHIISTSSYENQVVLDTFLGGGSTAVAALDLGRKFIGCEADKTIYQNTVKRVLKSV